MSMGGSGNGSPRMRIYFGRFEGYKMNGIATHGCENRANDKRWVANTTTNVQHEPGV